MKRFVYTIKSGVSKGSWVYSKIAKHLWIVAEYENGVFRCNSINTLKSVDETILSIINDEDFTNIYKNGTLVIMHYV